MRGQKSSPDWEHSLPQPAGPLDSMTDTSKAGIRWETPAQELSKFLIYIETRRWVDSSL